MTASSFALRAPGGLLAVAVKAAAIMGASVRRRLGYLSELAVRSSFIAFVLFVFAQLWGAVSRTADTRPGGYTAAQLVWYLAFAEVIVFTMSGHEDNEVDREVRTGEIAYRLARPVSYPLFHLAMSLGDRLLRCAVCSAIGAAVALAVVGPIPLRPAAVAAGVVALLLSVAVDELVALAISLSSFWIENTAGLHMLYRRACMILGGAFVPFDACPEWLARLCRSLPFRYLVAGPASLFVGADAAGFGHVVFAEIALAAAAAAAVVVVYRTGMRRVAVQGG